jgi:hypothetical protein
MVNLPSLGDEVLADELRGRVEALLAEIEELAEATRAHVEGGELRDAEAGQAGLAVGGSGAGKGPGAGSRPGAGNGPGAETAS